MSNLGLRLPIDIPWKRIGFSVHMMDREVCDRVRPVAMQPSVAVFAYEPDDSLDVGDMAVKVSYLKVTCSVTSYGATNLERLRKGRLIVKSPYEVRKSDEFDSSSQQLTGADLPCFGALLEVSVGPSSGNWSLDQYPYFSDFDPKKRELYELVSTTGEIVSRTLENTGVLHGGTTSSSNEVFDKDTWGIKGGVEGGTDKIKGKVEGSFGSEEGSRSVDSASFTNTRTIDAGREARETHSHTTQLSQMYQLLSSFHLGTNRAVFFFEPRPHIVQNERTFIDGPRKLEGIQEFFLVIVRPRTMKSLCVNASLETLHVGAVLDTGEPVPEPTATLHFPRIGMNGAWEDPDEDKPFPDENTVTYPAPTGWVIDQFKGTNGYSYNKLEQAGLQTLHKIEVTASTVTIWGRVEEHHYDGGIWEKDRRERGFLEVEITIYIKREVAEAARTKQFAILTNTSVCTCPLRRLEGIVDKPSIVRELVLPKTAAPVGRPMLVEVAQDWSKYFGQVVRSSVSSPDRYPSGAVDFWDLDVMKEPLAAVADLGRGRELAKVPVGRLVSTTDFAAAGFDEETRVYLDRPDVAEKPLAEMLRPPLREFVEASGLDFARATALRRALWDHASSGASTTPGTNRRNESDTA